MILNRVPLLVVALLAIAVAVAYLWDEIVPIFIIAVLGLPVAAYALNRAPRPDREA
jgi:hypothetical protein